MDELRRLWKQTRLLGLPMPAAPLTLVVMLVFLTTTGEAPTDPPEVLPLALTVVALVEIPLIFVIRRLVMGGVALMGPDEMAVQRADPVPVDESVAALTAAARRYYKATTVGGAIGFSLAMYGFILGYLFTSVTLALPFIAVSVLVIGVQIPRWTALLSLVPPGVVATVRRERLVLDGSARRSKGRGSDSRPH